MQQRIFPCNFLFKLCLIMVQSWLLSTSVNPFFIILTQHCQGSFFAVATQKSKTNTKHSKTHLCMCVFLMKLYLEVCWKKKTAVAEVIKDIPVIIYMRLNTRRAPKYVTLPHDHRGNHHSHTNANMHHFGVSESVRGWWPEKNSIAINKYPALGVGEKISHLIQIKFNLKFYSILISMKRFPTSSVNILCSTLSSSFLIEEQC